MGKVLVWAALLALALGACRLARPRRFAPFWAGLRGALWGGFWAALLAVLFAVCSPPGPFQLSIFLIGLNMLLVPSFLMGNLVRALRQPPQEAQEKPSFQGMLDEITAK